MCCCGKPTINGAVGAYSWDGHHFSTRQPSPPALAEGDELLDDEPGRCGGIDAHSHHFRLVKSRYGDAALLVRHGGGDERISLGCVSRFALPAFTSLATDVRFWLLHTLYSAHHDAANSARESTAAQWRQAAAEKRIKTHKMRGSVKVWIEPPTSRPLVEEAA